ncbi:hypothetical protein GWK91_00120 [Virgibacillus sp. MSP4-1]|uniref:hypothetical protein n=1 Tax=Virgibacillus sp. MSP4-1 TaxID=2700081 RepID=UPI0003A06DA8|nr:hypothetical protein [Virgibacillus sp. MSP4-1]QHS21458.1 hypothetical protein GWK91_00120 [Virgibacillus sp. MSP4-1]
MDVFIKNGKVIEVSEEEAKEIRNQGKPVTKIAKNMTQEELEGFKKERYRKFIKPIMEYNQEQLQDKRNAERKKDEKVMESKKTLSFEYGIQKAGDGYKVVKTLGNFKSHEEAQQVMIDLVTGKRTDTEVINQHSGGDEQ